MKDMYLKTNNGDMYYEKKGKGEAVVFLHGWGASSKTFKEVSDFFKDDFTVYVLDFLGFGLSDEPNKAIGISDYSSHLKMLMDNEKIDNPILIGHSFGGRVAIDYASKYKTKKLILVNSAGINHHNFLYYYKLIKYKIKKFYFYLFNKEKYYELIQKSGSDDYQKASFIMRGTFKKVVNNDLRKEMKKIKTPTLLIGGVFDKAVPMKDINMMHELIEGSHLITFYRSGHFSYNDEKENFEKVVMNFIKG